MGDTAKFLKQNGNVTALVWFNDDGEEKIIKVTLPIKMEFKIKEVEVKVRERKSKIQFCSIKCQKLGASLYLPRGKNHFNWKQKPSYNAIHRWIERQLGKPKNCSRCGTVTAKKYEWANISKKYKREINDWIRLCTRCHQLEDGHYKNFNKISQNPLWFNKWTNQWQERSVI